MTPLARAWTWEEVWTDVAARLATQRNLGRTHLLTEDVLRFQTVEALHAVDVAANELAIEVPDPDLGRGKLDLVHDSARGRAVVELKYPRGARSGPSPDPMTMGEVLRDFLRVASVRAAERWVVLVLEAKFQAYLTRRPGLTWPTHVNEELLLERDLLSAMSSTTRSAIGTRAWRLPVRATCAVAAPVGERLALHAFSVQGAPAAAAPLPLAGTVSPTDVQLPSAGVAQPPTEPDPIGARAEILAAIDSLAVRSGRPEVSPDDVVRELRRRGSRYAASTIRTMMTSHMCRQTQGPGIGTHDDLDRSGRGLYRRRDAQQQG